MLRERFGIPLRPARQQRRADAHRWSGPTVPAGLPMDTARALPQAHSRRRTPQRRYALLCIVAALLVTPALAYADLLTATITNQEQNVLEGTSAIFTVTLTGGTPSQDVEVQFKVSGTAEPETARYERERRLQSTGTGGRML